MSLFWQPTQTADKHLWRLGSNMVKEEEFLRADPKALKETVRA
jgi:hypothetical protein